MKKTVLLLAMAITLTSCYDFSREQKFKDAENNGKAILVEAQNSRKAMIETAKAQNESATLKAESMVKIARAQAMAEVERAKGVAEANKIIGNSLQGNDDYLRYLQIEAIKESKGDKVYIPTEAGLPILEARK